MASFCRLLATNGAEVGSWLRLKNGCTNCHDDFVENGIFSQKSTDYFVFCGAFTSCLLSSTVSIQCINALKGQNIIA
jgi:hypothetical protein